MKEQKKEKMNGMKEQKKREKEWNEGIEQREN